MSIAELNQQSLFFFEGKIKNIEKRLESRDNHIVLLEEEITILKQALSNNEMLRKKQK